MNNDLFAKILSDKTFLGAVVSTIFVILTGYYARKKKIVPENGGKVLSNILLNLTLPFLAFNAFMVPINDKTFTTGLSTFAFGFIAYIALIVLSFVLFPQFKGDRKDTLRILTIFGSTTFFGLPIIDAILPAGTLYANLFNIAYRVFLYSYALVVMSGAKFERKYLKQIFLNPIVIATFLGFVLWLLQQYAPQVNVHVEPKIVNKKFVEATVSHFAFYRIDQTLPWLFKAFQYLGNLSSPLAWLAIGMTLAGIDLKDAIKEKAVWYYSVVKLVVVPAVMLAVMLLINVVGTGFGFQLGYPAIFAITVFMATPPATVAVSYAINYEKEAELSSNASLLSTVLAVFAIIAWVIILTALNANGIFPA
ncbi:AEC family transporter [Streptococcus sp. DD13]|uniref:AEC family transporter n=1 Tax=Streptococcus sp. DD13 TaxID=1777881 RepID=UPI0007918BBC|nr:AEC family transporter [Streptococcus sp. DD13]KXT79061.1 Malate permease [Streptococcus sp. DD13]